MMPIETWVEISCPFNDVNNCNEFRNHFFFQAMLIVTNTYLFICLFE